MIKVREVLSERCSGFGEHEGIKDVTVKPIHTSKNVKATFNFVEATFDFVAKYGSNVE